MKKYVSIVLVLILMLMSLNACNFKQTVSGALAGEAEATPVVENMLSALAENRISDAKSFMHPEAINVSDDAFNQMCEFIAGRKANSVELQNISVNTSVGTAGRIKQEQLTYKVTLSDGDVMNLNVIYLIDNSGIGFTSFQLTLG